MNKPYKQPKYNPNKNLITNTEKDEIKEELFDVQYPIGNTTYDEIECREVPIPPPIKPKRTPATTTRKVDVDKLFRKLLTVLGRETDNLMISSFNGKLEKKEAESLISYLKLAKELKQLEEKALENLSDEELEKLSDGIK